MGSGWQNSAQFRVSRMAECQPLPLCGQTNPADVLLDAKDFAESTSHSRILRPRGENDAAVVGSPVRTIADSGLTSIAMPTPDLVPTTFRVMGKVVYLHGPTGKFLAEVGNLSPTDLETKPDLGTIKAIGNEAGGPASGHTHLVNDNDDHLIQALEDVSTIRTSECNVGDHKDTSEALSRKGQRGYKQLVRSQTVKIEPEQNYCPGQVAAALNLSYDSALRRMQKMKGVADFGTPTRRYKRRKRKLRISGRNLLAYIRTNTVV